MQSLVELNSLMRLTYCTAISVGISEFPLRFRARWALFPSKHTLGISKIRQGTDPGDRGCGVALVAAFTFAFAFAPDFARGSDL